MRLLIQINTTLMYIIVLLWAKGPVGDPISTFA